MPPTAIHPRPAASLPAGYEALEPFVARWALPSSAARAGARSNSAAEERAAFYAVAAPLAEPTLAALDAKPLAALTAPERTLLDLMLGFAHVSLAVEVQGKDEPWHRQWRDRMAVTAAPADRAA